jgi:hypothetical protein
MNATEEFLTEAFKDQGLVTQESIEQILAEAKAQTDSENRADDSASNFFPYCLPNSGFPKKRWSIFWVRN